MNHIDSFLALYDVNGGGKKWWDALPVETGRTEEYKVVLTNGFFTQEK